MKLEKGEQKMQLVNLEMSYIGTFTATGQG